MTTRLQKHGDGWAVVLDQATLDKMKITIDTPLQMQATDGQLVIAPEADFAAVIKKINSRYAETFRKLAE